MCDVTKYKECITALTDYIAYVNTGVDRLLNYELEMYAAYMTHNDEARMTNFSEWYKQAEAAYIATDLGISMWIANQYEVWKDKDIDQYFYLETSNGTIYECGGYWFERD